MRDIIAVTCIMNFLVDMILVPFLITQYGGKREYLSKTN